MTMHFLLLKSNAKVLVFLAAYFVTQTGCGGLLIGMATFGNRSIAHKTELWGGYREGEVYSLKLNMFVMRNNGAPKRLTLELSEADRSRFPHDMQHLDGPDTLEAYQSTPEKWPTVRGVVGEGTLIRIIDLREAGSAVWGQSIIVFAEVLDGPSKGAKVDLHDISIRAGRHDEYLLWGPDTRLLTRESSISNEI